MRNSGRFQILTSGAALAGVAGVGPAQADITTDLALQSVLPLAQSTNAIGLFAAEAEEEVLFEADLVTRAIEDGPIVATGNVQAYFGRRYLTADRLEYDPAADIVIAVGNVAITDENLETVFAGRVELTGDLRDGVAENFSALLEENARLAADNAVQEQGARTRLSKAVYTACNVCSDKGKAKTPTWRIKALRIVRDRERRVVRFHHAFFELLGVPILYTPYIQGPDPTVERQSGFLTPLFGASSRLGFNFELPYYFAFSNHTDATLNPRYTSNDGVLWQGEFRHRGNNSYNVLAGSIIDPNTADALDPNDPNANVDPTLPRVRWHVFGSGVRNFGQNFRLGYDVERVSDATFLRNYNIRRQGDLRKELDTSNTNRLRSTAYLAWQSGGSRLRVDGFLFQGLRRRDDASLTPYVAPRIDFRHNFQSQPAGGRASIRANFASLQRTGGLDTRRLTTSGTWERNHTTKGGHRLRAFAELRADAYFYQDLDEGTELTQGASLADDEDTEKFVGRFAPTAGLEWSYPLAKQTKNARYFIEPRAQIVVSPANRNPADIINEDSQSIEFDTFGLFNYNKSSGFDRFEDGQRLNAGLFASANFDSGVVIDGSVGAQFRVQETNAFDFATGLGGKQSDIIGSLNLRYKNIIGVQNRFRFDDGDGGLLRAESDAFLQLGPIRTNLTYVRLNEETLAAVARREELTARAQVNFTKHWSAGFSWRENLVPDAGEDGTIRQDFILAYRDECSSIALTYRRDLTQDRNLESDNAFLIQFTLRSLVD